MNKQQQTGWTIGLSLWMGVFVSDVVGGQREQSRQQTRMATAKDKICFGLTWLDRIYIGCELEWIEELEKTNGNTRRLLRKQQNSIAHTRLKHKTGVVDEGNHTNNDCGGQGGCGGRWSQIGQQWAYRFLILVICVRESFDPA